MWCARSCRNECVRLRESFADPPDRSAEQRAVCQPRRITSGARPGTGHGLSRAAQSWIVPQSPTPICSPSGRNGCRARLRDDCPSGPSVTGRLWCRSTNIATVTGRCRRRRRGSRSSDLTLFRGAWGVGVGAEHATVTVSGFQRLAAPSALVEVPARVGRHRLERLHTTQRAGNERRQRGHPTSVVVAARPSRDCSA